MNARIHIGVGGWTYEPWRNNFYPPALQQSRELAFAGSKLTAIEVNGTYYGTQKRSSFAKWRDETPDGFVFTLKGSRYATNRKLLATAGESIERFVESGIAELGAKLGPIVWQFATTKRFEADDFEAFLALLPAAAEGIALRHAVEVRNASFMCAEFLRVARKYQVATVFTDSADYPSFGDTTAGFVYARLMRAEAGHASGYAGAALDAIADCARAWSRGEEPAVLPRVEPDPPPAAPRDVYLYFIDGAKERAPAAAMALIERLR